MDPSSSRRHDQAHPNPSQLDPCSTHNHVANSTGLGLPGSSFLGAPGSLSATLPHQLSQLCSSQHSYPLLALQQNFSHLLHPNFPTPQQFNSIQSQIPTDSLFRSQRTSNNHHHVRHHDHGATTHHQRSHHNWRKSRVQPSTKSASLASDGAPFSLLNLSAKVVAEHIPFQSIERRYEHIPEPVQRQIIYWSFPRHEDDIKMYSSLTSETSSMTSSTSSTNAGNSSSQSPSSNTAFMWVEQSTHQNNAQITNQASLTKSGSRLSFHKGMRLYDEGCVQDALQVGFNLSGVVKIRASASNLVNSSSIRTRNNASGLLNLNSDSITNRDQPNVAVSESSPTSDAQSTRSYRVSVTFDRCKITSVSCSCELQDIFWCEHVVALIIYRIRNPDTIDLRVPISETLSSLDRQQLQKLVQYIIAEHHTEVLPTAQRLLDELRLSFSEINQFQGAPDPTAGACSDDDHIWHLDENQVNDKVQNYLNLVSTNSKDAFKQINALFEKIREMFRAKDSNGTRLLRLITEQFLLCTTRNDKSRSLWDHLVSLWVVVMLNPDLEYHDRENFVQLLTSWSRATKSPKEDVERRVSIKRKTAEISDDEESDEDSSSPPLNDLSLPFNRSNNYPAHMATHRRAYNTDNSFPALRQYNQLAMPPSAPCSCHVSRISPKKMRVGPSNCEQAGTSNRTARPAGPVVGQPSRPRPHNNGINENRPAVVQEPRSVFYRALDFMDASWDDPHLQMILNKDGPIDFESSKTPFIDCSGNPLWAEPISQSAARIETLRSYGYREQALRLTVATVRRLKFQQEQWWTSMSSNNMIPIALIDVEHDFEGWIGHPFDPINVMLDLLLGASMTEPNSNDNNIGSEVLYSLNAARCACPYEVMADFNKILPNLASLTYQQRNDAMSLLPMVNLPTRRSINSPSQSSANKTPFFHVPVPGCCQKDSYLTLGVELALIALSQQRSIPTITTAHERAVRQESDLISKLESIDMSDPVLIEILKQQTNLILRGGPFQNSCCGVSADSAPLHTFAKYLFESLVPHYSQMAYKIGVYALKMPLVSDENNENYGAARTSPRSINFNHLQSEQLILAQTMLTRAKEEKQFESFLRKVFRASIRNIRNAANLHKLSKHVLKEAKTSATSTQPPVYRAVLQTAFELGLQVLKSTLTPHSSNGKTRREAILFIVECSTDMGLDSVVQVMKDAREYFSPTEALNLVVSRDGDPFNNLRSQAIGKLKLKENPLDEARLNRRSRELALECAVRDPTNCALEAIKFCQVDEDSLKRALKIVIDSGVNRTMDSTQLIKVADYIHENMNMTDRAFDIAMVAVDTLTISANSDNSSMKKDIFGACEYASKVNGFSILIPKLLNNIECATVLSEIYHRFSPPADLMTTAYRHFASDVAASYRGNIYNKDYNEIMNSLNADIYKSEFNKRKIYKQKLEDASWWDALLKRTMKAFVDTTRNRLLNISPRHYGEFIDFLVKAQGIFEKAADGPKQFKDLLAEIVKSYKTKKKLMEKMKIRFELHITGKI